MSQSWTEDGQQGENEESVRGRRAVFLDRDGVINVNRSDHVKSWEEFQLLPGP